MSSPLRRLHLKLLRKAGKIKGRHKAINLMKGMPFRNCKVFYNEDGTVKNWIRYH